MNISGMETMSEEEIEEEFEEEDQNICGYCDEPYEYEIGGESFTNCHKACIATRDYEDY